MVHCNDPLIVGPVMSQLGALTVASAPSVAEVTSQVLSSHERMMAVGREYHINSIGTITMHLSRVGRRDLAQRVLRPCGRPTC